MGKDLIFLVEAPDSLSIHGSVGLYHVGYIDQWILVYYVGSVSAFCSQHQELMDLRSNMSVHVQSQPYLELPYFALLLCPMAISNGSPPSLGRYRC